MIAQQRGARTGVKGRAVPQRPAEPGVQLAVTPVGQRLLQLPERDVPAAQQVADRFQVAPVVGVPRGDVPDGQERQGKGSLSFRRAGAAANAVKGASPVISFRLLKFKAPICVH